LRPVSLRTAWDQGEDEEEEEEEEEAMKVR
jgi:hypothetical protein